MPRRPASGALRGGHDGACPVTQDDADNLDETTPPAAAGDGDDSARGASADETQGRPAAEPTEGEAPSGPSEPQEPAEAEAQPPAQTPPRRARPRRPVGQGVPAAARRAEPGEQEPWQAEETHEEDETWGEDEDADQDAWRRGEGWEEDYQDEWDEEYEYDESEGYEGQEGLPPAEESAAEGASAASAAPTASAASAHSTAAAAHAGGAPPRARKPAAASEDDEEAELAKATMTLGEHLEELRRRLIYAMLGLLVGMVVALVFGRQILAILESPYRRVMTRYGLDPKLSVLQSQAGFLIYLRVALISGMIFASPWIFYQLWKFVAAGLYRRERRVVMRAVPFSAALFVAGAIFFLLVVSERLLTFFTLFNNWLGVKAIVTQKDHIRFMTTLMLVFGLGFQTPLVVFVLGKVGIVSLKTLRRYRRHVIVMFLIVAAFATSPSPIDQIALALPMWLLYELGILLVWMSKRKEAREQVAWEAGESSD